MRRFLGLICLLLACDVDVDGAGFALSAGETRERPEPAGLEFLPDAGLAADQWEPRLDVPVLLDQYVCSALDVLFVVDNSGSMSDEQDLLIDQVPGFVQHLSQLGLGVEEGLHVGVITTDGYTQNDPDSCQTLGSLVTRVHGQPCGPYAEGFRYMTGEDDFDAAFGCAASVGALGSGSERPVDALLEALDDWTNRPGGCNEGFSRAEPLIEEHETSRAGLVVVILTDEDDTHSIGEPAEWVEHLRWLRGGTLSDTAVITITGDESCGEEPFKIQEFLELLPYSYEGTLCDGDFSEIFADAVPFVKEGCGHGWLPEG